MSAARLLALLAALILLHTPPIQAAVPAELVERFEEELDDLGSDLESRYGYGSSKTDGAVEGVLLVRTGGDVTYLLLQPLDDGTSVGGIGEIKNGRARVRVSTRDDLLKGVASAISYVYTPRRKVEATAKTVSIGDQPIENEESALKRGIESIGQLDTVQAVRSRDDNTYLSPPEAVTLYYVSKGGAANHYVLVSELIGSVKSGKPYVDVYLRGFNFIGGMMAEDGSPRSEMMKSKPWRQLEEVPDVKDFRTMKKRSSSSNDVPGLASGQVREATGLTHRALNRDVFEDAQLESSDAVCVAGVHEDEDDLLVYIVAGPPGGEPGLAAGRVSFEDGKDDGDVDRVMEVSSTGVEYLVDTLRDSEPAERQDDEEDEDEPEEKEWEIPGGSDPGSEKGLRSLAIQMFDADPGLQMLLTAIAKEGGRTGKSHAITIGRDMSPRNPLQGVFYFLVTRTTTEYDVRKKDLKDGFSTWGRIYAFPFQGGEVEEMPVKSIKKLMTKKNVE